MAIVHLEEIELSMNQVSMKQLWILKKACYETTFQWRLRFEIDTVFVSNRKIVIIPESSCFIVGIRAPLKDTQEKSLYTFATYFGFRTQCFQLYGCNNAWKY